MLCKPVLLLNGVSANGGIDGVANNDDGVNVNVNVNVCVAVNMN